MPITSTNRHVRPLRSQKALVTGASSGIGRAVAVAFGRAGADVAVNYRSSPGAAEAIVAEIRGHGVTAFAHQADVSDEAQVLRMFERAREELGAIDILVANAIGDMTAAQWNKVLSVNLTGQFLCAREAIREFRRRGLRPEISCSAGKIICMSSVHQEIPWAGHINYAASKGGVELMMRSLAQEVAPERIRVNAIAPGAIRTDQSGGVGDERSRRTALDPHSLWAHRRTGGCGAGGSVVGQRCLGLCGRYDAHCRRRNDALSGLQHEWLSPRVTSLPRVRACCGSVARQVLACCHAWKALCVHTDAGAALGVESCSKVHCRGDLSGRQRTSLVPCRKRSPFT